MRTFWRKLVSSRTSGVRKRYSLTGSHAFEVFSEHSLLLGVRCDASFDPMKVLLFTYFSFATEARWSNSATDLLTDLWMIGNYLLPFLRGLAILNSFDLFELLLLASLDANWVSVSLRRMPLDFGIWTGGDTNALLRQEFARLWPGGVLLKPVTA